MSRAATLNLATCLLAVFPAMALAWGFTVDDALISTRVAYHLNTGVGYRFNPDGDIVDCVTPLGWAQILMPFASEPFAGLAAARWIGVACTFVWALVVGVRCKEVSPGRFALVALPLSICLPLGAWSVSGMETPMIALFVAASTLAPRWSLVMAGVAAGLRPELVPYAFVLSVLRPARHWPERCVNLAAGLLGPLIAIAVRLAAFGHPAPLAVFAKPSDFSSGLFYALAGLLWLGLPLLLLAPMAWSKTTASTRILALAALAHTLALVVVGGDWMSLFRLFIPIVPVLVVVAAELAGQARFGFVLGRSALASLICGLLLIDKGPEARNVWASRFDVSTQAAPHLVSAERVLTLDVGWVGATTRAPIIDLAGVTDPEVAWLPGAHTNKRLPSDFLLRREPDALVLLLLPGVTEQTIAESAWTELPYARAVEQRLTRMRGAEAFVPVASIELRGTSQRYLILRRLSQRLAQSNPPTFKALPVSRGRAFSQCRATGGRSGPSPGPG